MLSACALHTIAGSYSVHWILPDQCQVASSSPAELLQYHCSARIMHSTTIYNTEWQMMANNLPAAFSLTFYCDPYSLFKFKIYFSF